MSQSDQHATPSSSLSWLPTPQGTPRTRDSEVKQGQHGMSEILALLKKMDSRIDKLENMPGRVTDHSKSAPDLADAVAAVSSYRGGRPGGASAFTTRARVAPTPTASAKEQLRRPKPTPFPPGRPLRFDAPYHGDDSDDDSKTATTTAAGVCPGDGRVAEELMANILNNYRSALDYVRSIDFKNQRSGHEARRTAQAIDAFVREGVSLHYEGMEILVRTLAGVVEADNYGEPAILTEMEWQPPQEIVPRAMIRTVLKDVKRRREIKPKKQPASRDQKNGGQQGGAGKHK